MKNVAIIGSGMGGLVAGNLIARKGHKVTIFEGHTAPGGYTSGFRRKGFYFESGAVAFEYSAALFKALDDAGLREKVRFARATTRWVSPFFDLPLDSYESFKRDIRRGFPAEGTALDGYFAELDRISAAMRPLMGRPMPSQFSGLGTLRAMLPYVTKGWPVYRLFKEYAGQTVEDIAARHFPRGTPLFRLFTETGYPRMGVDGLGGFFIMLFEDYWHVVGGMRRLADVLADGFRKAGGQIRFGARVERILTKDGAAVGVVAGGETVSADAVVAACDYKRTFLELLDDPALVPPERLDAIRKARVSEGIFTVYLGLDMTNEQLQRALRAVTVQVSPLAHDLDFDDPRDPDHFAKCGFSLHSSSLVDPELAPEGKSSLMIHAISPIRWQDNWHKGDRERYAALKQRVTRTLVARAEAVVPDLASRIVFEDSASPLTFERYTGNTDGATSAWSWDPHKAFYEGGGMGRMTVSTPVRNLFTGSCWISQIGGVPSAINAGYLCAKRIR
jgi:phytoene dehydrogenase-like protein